MGRFSHPLVTARVIDLCSYPYCVPPCDRNRDGASPSIQCSTFAASIECATWHPCPCGRFREDRVYYMNLYVPLRNSGRWIYADSASSYQSRIGTAGAPRSTYPGSEDNTTTPNVSYTSTYRHTCNIIYQITHISIQKACPTCPRLRLRLTQAMRSLMLSREDHSEYAVLELMGCYQQPARAWPRPFCQWASQ